MPLTPYIRTTYIYKKAQNREQGCLYSRAAYNMKEFKPGDKVITRYPIPDLSGCNLDSPWVVDIIKRKDKEFKNDRWWLTKNPTWRYTWELLPLPAQLLL